MEVNINHVYRLLGVQKPTLQGVKVSTGNDVGILPESLCLIAPFIFYGLPRNIFIFAEACSLYYALLKQMSSRGISL